jgi:glc operon protein GlcG
MATSLSEQLLAEVIHLYPSYITNPLDVQWNHGNAVAMIVDSDGKFHGHIFGGDKAIGQKCYQIATRKVMQVWRTGYRTGRFEELVYAGKLDENEFGVQRPDLIGWEGGVPFIAPDGRLIAAAFSGFRGVMDVEILVRAAEAIGLQVKPHPANL